jgi:hypothetical protein
VAAISSTTETLDRFESRPLRFRPLRPRSLARRSSQSQRRSQRRPRVPHSDSEYGEGNFYFLRALTKTGKQSWRASAGLGLDTRVGSPNSAPVIVKMQIEKRKLIALIEGPVGNASENGKASTYFRCRNVPRSFMADRESSNPVVIVANEACSLASFGLIG